MREETAALLQRAREDLASAKHSLGGGFARAAVSSAYYSMFHAAEALLAEKGLDSSSHKGLLATVSLEYVRPRLLAPEQGRQLREAFERRLRADYDVTDHLPAEMAREGIAWAAAFIEAAEGILAGPLDTE